MENKKDKLLKEWENTKVKNISKLDLYNIVNDCIKKNIEINKLKRNKEFSKDLYQQIIHAFNLFGWMIGATITIVGVFYQKELTILIGLSCYLLNYFPYVEYLKDNQ